jgi:hypothetical protein
VTDSDAPVDEFDRSAFAERLLQIIDEGRRTATYKLALILALIDACAEHVDADGDAPDSLDVRTIAEHVIGLYFPQVRLYLAMDGSSHELRQITMKSSVTINAVLALYGDAHDNGAATLHEARAGVPQSFERCVERVADNFGRYPLRLLQIVAAPSGRSSTTSRGRRSDSAPARPINCCDSHRWSAHSSSCTGRGWSRRSVVSTSRRNTCALTSSGASECGSRSHCATD